MWMKNNENMNKYKIASEASRSLSDILKNLKIDSIVLVDDARNISPEEMKKIREELSKSDGTENEDNV